MEVGIIPSSSTMDPTASLLDSSLPYVVLRATIDVDIYVFIMPPNKHTRPGHRKLLLGKDSLDFKRSCQKILSVLQTSAKKPCSEFVCVDAARIDATLGQADQAIPRGLPQDKCELQEREQQLTQQPGKIVCRHPSFRKTKSNLSSLFSKYWPTSTTISPGSTYGDFHLVKMEPPPRPPRPQEHELLPPSLTLPSLTSLPSLRRTRSHTPSHTPLTLHNPTPTTGFVSTAANSLKELVRNHWPIRHHSRYKRVSVLLMRWDENDSGQADVDQATAALAKLFHEKYGFEVQTWIIPSLLEPKHALEGKLESWVNSVGAAKDNLLILWYCGAARETEGGVGPVVWFGDRFGPDVESTIVPTVLARSQADVLTIYDSPFSVHSTRIAELPNNPGRVYEHIGSTASRVAPGFSTNYSLTRSLITILERPDNIACGISVLDLHLQALRARDPGHGYTPADWVGVDTLAMEFTLDNFSSEGGGNAVDLVRPAVVYAQLSGSGLGPVGSGRSIVLSRLRQPLVVYPTRQHRDGWPGHSIRELSLSHEQGSRGGGRQREVVVQLELRMGAKDLQGSNTGAGDADKIDMERWKEWIMAAPGEIEVVNVKGPAVKEKKRLDN